MKFARNQLNGLSSDQEEADKFVDFYIQGQLTRYIKGNKGDKVLSYIQARLEHHFGEIFSHTVHTCSTSFDTTDYREIEFFRI